MDFSVFNGIILNWGVDFGLVRLSNACMRTHAHVCELSTLPHARTSVSAGCGAGKGKDQVRRSA